jgi:hypothetical protein
VPAPFEFQGNGDQRIDVAQGTDIRENNAQNEGP